jgi:penicillin-binding protein 1B
MSRKPRRSSKSKPHPRKSGGRRRGWLRTLGRWLILPLLGLTLVGVLYGIYLDQVVQTRFEGRRWTLPARVYARPLELFAGRRLSPDALQEELERLGYTRTKHPNRPGAYSRHRQRFLLRTRPFSFWDGKESSRYLEVKFKDGRIASLKPAAGGPDPGLARLDAAHIGSIYPAHQEDRMLLQRKELPELLVRTLLAVEDRHFYQHHGVDQLAILRALWSNLRAGRVVQGGSTLTQQLIKSFYLSNERSLPRKLHEAAMALLLERRYGKEEILEAYANEIYMGQDGRRAIHGFALASLFYFNRPLAELDLARTALLVGLIKGPSLYNPRGHPERARQRRNLVLDLLAQQGVASAEQVTTAKRAELGVSRKGGRPTGRYPAFMELVRRQLKRDYREADLNSEGLRIFTTLDPLVQVRAEQAIARRLPQMEKSKRSAELEAAAVVAGAENGEVLALVGGRRSGYSGFNRALEAVRPIGSLIKPVVYLEALSRPDRYTPVSPLKDQPVQLKGRDGKLWRPKNFDGKTHGRVPLYQALARSYNLATVNLGMDLGLQRVVQRLQDLGLEREVRPLPSLLLGSLSLTPLEVAQLYQGLAAGGFRAPLRAVREVLDANGRSLSRYPLEMQQVADPGPVHLLNWVLGQVVEQGTGRGLKKQLPKGLRVAGKTGTSDDYRDSWFAGFSGDKVAVVWVGRDDNKPAGLSGSTGAMRVWGDIIAGSDSAPLLAQPPRDVEILWVEPASGLLADAQCPGALQVPFLRGSGPREKAACGRKENRVRRKENPVKNFFERFFQ